MMLQILLGIVYFILLCCVVVAFGVFIALLFIAGMTWIERKLDLMNRLGL